MRVRSGRTVCGVCGEPAIDRVTIKVGGRSLVKDLCGRHLEELTLQTRSAHSAHLRLADPIQDVRSEGR